MDSGSANPIVELGKGFLDLIAVNDCRSTGQRDLICDRALAGSGWSKNDCCLALSCNGLIINLLRNRSQTLSLDFPFTQSLLRPDDLFPVDVVGPALMPFGSAIPICVDRLGASLHFLQRRNYSRMIVQNISAGTLLHKLKKLINRSGLYGWHLWLFR